MSTSKQPAFTSRAANTFINIDNRSPDDSWLSYRKRTSVACRLASTPMAEPLCVLECGPRFLHLHAPMWMQEEPCKPAALQAALQLLLCSVVVPARLPMGLETTGTSLATQIGRAAARRMTGRMLKGQRVGCAATPMGMSGRYRASAGWRLCCCPAALHSRPMAAPS